jgi:F-box and WD-40 domain protein 1/11
MGDSDEDADDGANESFGTGIGDVGLDSGFASMSLTLQPVVDDELPLTNRPPLRPNSHPRFSAPPPTSQLKVNYKLLHQTHIRLHNRFLSSSYRLSALQTRGAPTDSHTNTIYCLQLYTYPSTGTQVLFTGSRDRTVREWNLTTGLVERVISGVHESSVLSICVHKGFVASAGSDRRVVVWDLGKNRPVKVICDHEDSVLCVRFDDERLVSCSKGTHAMLFPWEYEFDVSSPPRSNC